MYQLAIVVGSDHGGGRGMAAGQLAARRGELAVDVRLGAGLCGHLCHPAVPGSGESALAGGTGKIGEAQAIFTRIDGPAFAKTEMDEIEKSLAAEAGSWGELFTPGLRMALLVGLCLALFNNYTGWIAMAGYLAHLFVLGGLSRTDAIFQYLLAYGFMGVMTLVACGLVDRAGRRPLWLVSSLVMIGANALLGLVFYFNFTGIVVLAAVFLCAIPHSFALGPLPWLMMSEIFPTRIRARAVAITTTFIWLVGFLAGYLFPILAEVSRTAHRIDRRRVLALRHRLRSGVCFWTHVAAGDQGANVGGDCQFVATAAPGSFTRQNQRLTRLRLRPGSGDGQDRPVSPSEVPAIVLYNALPLSPANMRRANVCASVSSERRSGNVTVNRCRPEAVLLHALGQSAANLSHQRLGGRL